MTIIMSSLRCLPTNLLDIPSRGQKIFSLPPMMISEVGTVLEGTKVEGAEGSPSEEEGVEETHPEMEEEGGTPSGGEGKEVTPREVEGAEVIPLEVEGVERTPLGVEEVEETPSGEEGVDVDEILILPRGLIPKL